MVKKLIQNQVRCNRCGDEPYSASVHDYKECKCGSIAVDGGLSYTRRVGNINEYTEISMSLEEEVIADITSAAKWGKDNGRNDYGIALAVVRALNKHGILDKDKI